MILREKAAAYGSPWQRNRHTDDLAVQRRACFAALAVHLAVRTIDTNSAIRKPLLRLTLQRIERRGWSSVGRHLL